MKLVEYDLGVESIQLGTKKEEVIVKVIEEAVKDSLDGLEGSIIEVKSGKVFRLGKEEEEAIKRAIHEVFSLSYRDNGLFVSVDTKKKYNL